MRVEVQVPMGHCAGETSYDLDMDAGATLLSLKPHIEAVTGIPVDEQWILAPWEGRMPTSATLADLNVHEG